METVKDFGSRIFGDAVMKEMLSPEVYESIRRTRREGKQLDPQTAEAMAGAILKWALSQNATHYIHWFQPLTDTATGKAESFVSPCGDGRAIYEFSSSALIQGESDASSFPSGGLRNTFEARGYTAWDPSSSLFVKDGILYIPTVFCGYNGEGLDHKMPLLRSMDALSDSTVRLLRALGDEETSRVTPMVGAEQEYFIIDREKYEQRLDLKICGRTLIGAPPPKRQELDDHYYGRVRLRVAAFMRELDREMWKFGIAAKTKHNEVAPTQHELACVFDTAGITCDNNHLLMQVIKEIAKRHNLAALLHEKPFSGVNGSGKHNNYSLVTDRGVNLLNKGKTEQDEHRFMLIIAAFIRAVDIYSDLLRVSAATPGNDSRLGGFEAPPAIISMFLGDPITEDLKNYGNAKLKAQSSSIDVGISFIPDVLKDDMDRNRTSPFAYTKNKFEFRMLSSSQSIAFPNTVINTMLADTFDFFAQRLESAGDADKADTIAKIIEEVYKDHCRIIFNGNNYSEAWREEASQRGLVEYRSSLDAYEVLLHQKNIDLFIRYGIFDERECRLRYEVLLGNYIKIINIEARTLLEMVRRQVLPSLVAALSDLSGTLSNLKNAGIENKAIFETALKLSTSVDNIKGASDILHDHLDYDKNNHTESALYMRDVIRVDMSRIRGYCDEAEAITSTDRWPMPTYTDLMHRV